MGILSVLTSHIGHQSLDKRSPVFSIRATEAQQPLIVPNRPYWAALAPLPLPLLACMSIATILALPYITPNTLKGSLYFPFKGSRPRLYL